MIVGVILFIVVFALGSIVGEILFPDRKLFPHKYPPKDKK